MDRILKNPITTLLGVGLSALALTIAPGFDHFTWVNFGQAALTLFLGLFSKDK